MLNRRQSFITESGHASENSFISWDGHGSIVGDGALILCVSRDDDFGSIL